MAARETQQNQALPEVAGEDSAAPHQPTKAQIAQGADSPDSRENTGQVLAPREFIVGTEVPIAQDPAAEGTRQALEDSRRVKTLRREETREEKHERTRLPDDAFESAAFKAANNAARDSFASVVRRPGDKFVDHGGRYVNIDNLSEVYDVEPNSVVPDGLFLFPVNYLVRDADEVRGR